MPKDALPRREYVAARCPLLAEGSNQGRALSADLNAKALEHGRKVNQPAQLGPVGIIDPPERFGFCHRCHIPMSDTASYQTLDGRPCFISGTWPGLMSWKVTACLRLIISSCIGSVTSR